MAVVVITAAPDSAGRNGSSTQWLCNEVVRVNYTQRLAPGMMSLGPVKHEVIASG